MDFFASQDRARRNTGILVGYFVLAVVCIIAAIYLVFAFLFVYSERADARLFDPMLLAAVSAGTLIVIVLGSLYKTAMLSSGGGASVAEMLGGQLVQPNTTDLDERRLLNVVEEMALASGTPVPPVYLLRNEAGINAFAAGFSPADAVVGVTRGCVQLLSRDELQGVIAHEFSHMLRGDMRLNLRLMGVLHGILVISLIGYFLLRATSTRRHYFSSKKKGGNPLPLIGLALYIIGYAGVFAGKLIKSGISRQREYLADASAVQFTRNPLGIAGALGKIGGFAEGAHIADRHAEQASHMFFSNALKFDLLGMMATHPPLQDRIQRIDPSFSGKFKRVTLGAVRGAPEAEPLPMSALLGAEASAASSLQPAPAEAPLLPVPASSMAFAAADVAGHVGAPQPAHVQYAARLLDSLPGELKQMLHELSGGYSVVLALLLAHDEQQREQQLRLLGETAEGAIIQGVQQAWPLTSALPAESRLPVVELAMPTLRGMSSQQFEQFTRQVKLLAEADRQTSLFEFALERMVLRHLRPTYKGLRAARMRHHRAESVAGPIARLLATMAHAGHADEAAARQAFALGMSRTLPQLPPPEMLPRRQADLRQLDADLDELAASTPSIKRQVLEGCVESISSDGQLTVPEGELLRAVADSLDCPMPPLIAKVL